jgi:peptidoglycan/LPS O-acetylase OafA/YrhL
MIRLTPLHLEPLALGALLASSGAFLAWAARWRWPLLLLGVAGLWAPLPAGLGILTSGLGASGLVAMAVTRPLPALRVHWLRRCGKYSYAMYLLQPAWIVPALYKKHPHSAALMLGALIAGPLVTYAMAVVSWNVLEKRMLALKRYFPYRLDSANDQLDRNEPHVVVAQSLNSTPEARR